MYRITVEEEKNGVFQAMEGGTIVTPGYLLAAQNAEKTGATHHIMNVSTAELALMLLHDKNVVRAIMPVQHLLPIALHLPEKHGAMPPVLDAEAMLQNTFPMNSEGGAQDGPQGAKPARRGLFAKRRGKGHG